VPAQRERVREIAQPDAELRARVADEADDEDAHHREEDLHVPHRCQTTRASQRDTLPRAAPARRAGGYVRRA
jgi:hypothetical protein